MLNAKIRARIRNNKIKDKEELMQIVADLLYIDPKISTLSHNKRSTILDRWYKHNGKFYFKDATLNQANLAKQVTLKEINAYKRRFDKDGISPQEAVELLNIRNNYDKIDYFIRTLKIGISKATLVSVLSAKSPKVQPSCLLTHLNVQGFGKVLAYRSGPISSIPQPFATANGKLMRFEPAVYFIKNLVHHTQISLYDASILEEGVNKVRLIPGAKALRWLFATSFASVTGKLCPHALAMKASQTTAHTRVCCNTRWEGIPKKEIVEQLFDVGSISFDFVRAYDPKLNADIAF